VALPAAALFRSVVAASRVVRPPWLKRAAFSGRFLNLINLRQSATARSRPGRSSVKVLVKSTAMATTLDCQLRGLKHDWRRREERYSFYSTQSAGFYWKCERCGKETETDKKPEN